MTGNGRNGIESMKMAEMAAATSERKGFWGRGLAARALQVAVVVAVTSSVPAAWSANKGAPASVTAASTPNLHVNKVAAGSASFLNTGNLTTVTTGSSRTIINYQYLSVPAGTTLDFVQPNVKSRVLNRIEGDVPTAIDGTLKSNGIVYLVSPAGVIFGNGAVVTAGKFFAAAAHMSDGDFLTGKDHFTGGSGAVTNYGTITAEQVHLVGASVANFGEIIAPSSVNGGGVVTMTAGKDVYIGTTNSPTDQAHVLVKVSSDTSTTAAGTGVTNSGSITAGQIRLGAGDLYAAGIYNNGLLRGTDITVNSGASTTITSGIVDASSSTGRGGSIELLGDKVGVTGGSVSASGVTGGGTVLIGGALHGGGGVQVATDTVISTGVTVSADGTGSKADGGTVVVFSSAWTKVAGAISAVGGAGGAGGFVETSSHGQLSVLTAPSVGTGTWLMDPTDVTIISGVAVVSDDPNDPQTTTGTPPNATTTFTPTTNAATVSNGSIEAALLLGSHVVIETASAGASAGDITFSTPLTIVTAVGTPSLTLNAAGAITLGTGNAISTTGTVPLAVAFNAGGSTTISDNIATNGGTFTSTGVNFNLTAGTINTAGGDVVLNQTGTVTIAGSITAGSGTVWSTGTDFTNSGAITSGTAINILHTGNVSLGANLDVSGTGTLSIAGVSVVQTAGTITAGTAAIQTTGDDGSASKFAVKLDDANPIGALAISSTGAGAIIDVTTNGALSIGSTGALSGVPTGLPAFGAVTGITAANGTVTIDAGGALSVANAIGTSNGTVSLTAAGNITVSAAINAGTGDADLTASTGDINGSGSIAITAANVTLEATAGGVGIGHVVTVTSGANVSITTGGTDAAGDASFAFTGAAHTADITLADTAGSQTGLTYTITAGNGFVVNSNFGTSAASLNITANGAAISATGSNVLTADTLTLTSNGTGIGSTSQPLTFADSTSASFTGNGDIFVSGNLDKPITFTTDATPRTIGVIGGAVTVGTNLSAGANNTLIVDGTTSVTVSAGKTLSGATVYVTSAGDVTVTGNITASGPALLLGNTVSGAGIISGNKVGVEATGILTGVSINLSNVSSGTVAASGPVTLGGTVTIGTTGNVTVGSVAAFSPSGFTAFAAVSGVKGNGNNVSVTAGGNITLANDVDGGLLGNATVNANGTASNILETGGVVKGANINLLATGGIGANGTPVQVGTLGGIALTTGGANQTGSIYVQINNALSLGSLTVTTDATVQTVSIAELATLSLTGSVSFGTDDVGLSGTNLSLNTGQTITAGNVTLAATSGNLSVNGNVTGGTGGLVTLTAAGGDLGIAGNVSSGTGGTINISTTAGNISQTAGSITTSGGTVTVNAVGGTLTVSGTAITVGAGNVSLSGASGVSQTAGTIGAAGGNVTVNSSSGNVALSGTVSASGGAVVVSGGVISGGNVTASTLSVNAGTTISLTGNAVGTLAASANGTVGFTNSGGLAIGKIGSITGVTSGGNDITLRDTTGAVAINQAVTAGAGNASVRAATNITSVSGANGTVTGNVVTLTADTGDVGVLGTPVKTASSDLVLSGSNVTVADANAFATTGASRLSVSGVTGALDLSAPTINVTTSLLGGTQALTLRTSTGGVTTTGSGSLVGSFILIDSAAGIGTAGTALSIAPGAFTSMSFTANGTNIWVASTTNLDLGHVTVSDSSAGISFTAPTMTTSADFTAGSNLLKLVTTTGGSGITLTHTLTATGLTLITDDVVTGTGTFNVGSGNVLIVSATAGRTINVSSAVISGDLNIGEAVLQNTTAGSVNIGNSTTTGTMVIGPMDLHTASYNFNLSTSGQYNFQGTLTLKDNTTLTLDGASSIVNSAATAVAIGGTTGTLTITNIGGDIGSFASPLTTAVERLGGATGTGHLFIDNTGALNVTGAVTMTAGGVASNNSIAAHSPLTISAPVAVVGDLALTAGDNAAAPGDALTVTANVHATGNITLQAGDGIVLSGGIISTPGNVSITANHEDSLTDLGLGIVNQTGTAGIQAAGVDAHATTGIHLNGSNNQIGTLSAQNVTGSASAIGTIVVSNTGAAGLALTLGTITNDGGAVSILTTGALSQSGVITAQGTLTVQTENASGAPITLTNANNLFGNKATLQVLDASGGTTVAANVSFTTAGAMHLQQIQSGANVSLVATTIDQDLTDVVGIHAGTLTVQSNGAVALTNSHNDFSTLSATDSSAGSTVKYTTAASGGLTITTLTQIFGGTANITNSSGAVNSTAALDQQNLNVVASGGISLTSNGNILQSVTATNTTGGDINIHESSFLPVTFTAISETGGGVTSLTSASDLTFAGTIGAGAGLTVDLTTAGGTYSETSAAVVTSSGPVVIIADHMAIDPASSLTATGQQVTLKPLTLSETIAINGAESAGQLGLLNSELATISSQRLTIGAFVAPADPGNQTGNVVSSGAFNLPTNVRIITTGNVSLAGAAITTTLAGSQSLEVDHGGTLSLGTATIDGGFSEFGASGSGSGGVVSLSGALTTTDHAVNFLSSVVLTADTTIDTSGSTGADITFANTTSSVSGGHNLTLKAQGGNISFASAAGGGGNPLGLLTVGTGGNVTFPAVNASGENINNTGVLTLNGTQTLGALGFVQTNASDVALNADIITSSGPITLNSLTTLSGGTRTLDATAGNTTSGANITLNGVVSGGSSNFTLTAGTGNVAVNAPVTTLGIFTSTGNDFANGNATNQTAVISAGGIRILHNILTGQVEIWSNLNSPGFNVVTQGANVTLEHGATITGDQVDQPAGVGVFINDSIFAPNGYTSSGDTPYTITATGSITTNGANATINYPLGLVTIDGPINTHGVSSDGVLVINGLGITSGTTGTITAGVVTLNGEGHDVTIGGAVSATGLFTSTGANFTNTATVSVAGANLTHTGLVTIDANFTGNGSNVSISGVGILSNVSGTLGGNAITLAGGTGNVTIGGALNGSGLLTVTGANFLNTANVSSVGGNISMPTGAVNFDAPITSGSGDLLVTSVTVTSNANGTIGGANITLNETGSVSLGATVTGTGDFVSNGTTFSGIDISAATMTLNHTGLVTLNGNLTASSGTGPIQITGAGVTQAAGIIDSGSLTLLGTGTFTLTDGNTVGILSANITGPLTFVNADDLIVGDSGTPTISGITTHGGALSLTVNTGDLTVSSPINTGAGAITFLTSAGSEHVNANVTSTSTFSSNGTGFTSNATITANGITLTQTGLVDLNGALEGGTSPVNITGVGITSSANGTIDGGTVTLTAGTGDEFLSGTITASGLFTSTGANFTNNAEIQSAGANITQTALVTLNGALEDGSNAVNIFSVGIFSTANGTIDGGTITLAAGAGNTTLNGAITGSGLFTSTGGAFTNNASVTTAGANITSTGAVNIDGGLFDSTNAILITGIGITSDANGTMQAGNVTLVGQTGDVSLAGTITASGFFQSTGANFTNTASITSAGASVTHTGPILIDGALIDGTSDILLHGPGITSTANGTMTAGNVTLTAGAGNVALAGDIHATGLLLSTGANFTNTGNLTSAGANITHTGSALIDGALIDIGSPVLIDGIGITSTANGTMTTGALTLTAHSGDISLAGVINASGLFTSTGAAFINTASITSVGANITQTGAVQIHGALDASNHPVNITGDGISSNVAGTIAGSTITLTGGVGDVNLAGNVTGSGLFTSTGAAFTNTGSITSAGANITHTGAVNIDGALVDSGSPIFIDGFGITSNANGTMQAGNITLTGHTGNVTLAGTITATGFFKSTGAGFTNTANITSAGANITHTGSALIDGNLADGGNAILIDAVGITSTTRGSMQTGPVTLTAHSGDVSLAGTITASGLFTSTGAAFTNTASITSAGANLTHTGLVQIQGALIDGISAINIIGNGIHSTVAGTMAAGPVTLTGGSGDVILAGNINASGLFTSTGAAFTNTGSITSAGANITHSGAVNIDGALADGSNAITITGAGISSNASGTMNAGPITLTGGSGDVNLAGVITASGLFTSTGAAFTNTANITSAGAILTHTGAVNIDGALNDGSNAVTITGHGIASNSSGPITAGNITLTAGSGDVSLAGTVLGSGFFKSTGAGFLNTATITVAGANLTHTGFVQIHNAFDSTGNAVTITGQGIDSNAAGTIHATTLALNSLDGDATLSGNITATGLFTSTGIGFTNNGTISAVGITLTHSGAVVINNTMDAHTGALSITGASSIADANSTLTGVGVTLHASGFITVGNTINAGSGAALLTSDGSSVTDTGDILAGLATITAATNATASNITTSNGNIAINAPAGITLRGNLLAGTSSVLVNGPATLVADIVVIGSNATFVSSIGGAGRSLTINASGLTTLGGDVGSAGAPLASISTDAPGTTTLHGSIFTTGNLFILDPLTLTANSTISGGTVKFGGTIVGGGVSLAVTSTALSDFAGSIGAGTGNALTTFSVSGATATFHGATITTIGAETFNAKVLLANPLAVTGTAFTFGDTINSLGTPAGLTITGHGPLVLNGEVGGTDLLGSFLSTGSTGTSLSHPITTTGDISIAGPITIGTTLKSTTGNVSLPGAVQMTGNTNVTANGLGGITFGLGGITGNHNLTFTSNATGAKTAVGAIGTGTSGRVGNLTFNSAGVVALGGNIFAQNVKFGYKDGGAAPTFNPTISTIYYAKGDLVINTSGTFDMEQNQSLAVFAAPVNFQSIYGTPTGNGNLTIVSNNHAITIGDISAQGTVTIDAGDVHQTISIRTRPGVQVALADGGTLNSPAVGITSGLTSPNALILKGTLSVIPSTGSQNQVFFSSGAATVDIANTISLQLGDVTKILDFNRTNTLTGKSFLNANGTIALNQVPTGLGLPPQNQVNVVPRDIQTLQPERAAAISGALKDALQEIGIYARDVRTDELIEYLVGTALYDDVPYKLDPSPQDMKVAANRLPYAPVLPTVDAYRALFLKPELDANGKPVLDDKGKPKMVVQNTIILNTFGQTWLAYKMEMKDKATPEGFRGWLEANEKVNKKNESALSYLDQLRDLLNQIRSLGLTSTEYDVSKKVLLSKVRPANIKEDDFLSAIMGPSTRARTMTAMRNGDKHPGRG